MRGRKPIPTYLKVLNGNPGKRALNREEPVPIGQLVEPSPNDFTESQLAIWRNALAECAEGQVMAIDASLFEMWVVNWDLARKASREVNRLGAIVKAPVTGIPMRNPWVNIRKDAQLLYKAAAAELGFTPSSRTRVKVKKPKKSNAFADLKELGDD